MRFLFVFILLTQFACTQNIVIEKKIDIPNDIDETSGIVYLKNKKEIITFNDSGGKPELYVLNAKTGKLKKTVKVKNATNIDWESITQDLDYIYVGDTGNNYGNRTNLVIYKIAKKDLKKGKKAKAKKIYYTYEDQTSFEINKHKTNFDCESITIYKNKLYLFTKNWGNHKTTIYEIPTSEGKHVAHKINSIDINCMLTSIAYNPENDVFLGTAYDRDYQSYLIQINNLGTQSQNFKKISLFEELGLANQTEAISWKDNSTIYISREASSVSLKGKKYKRKQKLILISLEK